MKNVIIFDGDCAICHLGIRWIKKYEVEGHFEYLPCQSPERENRFPEIPGAECMTAIHVIDDNGNVYAGADALPLILMGMRGWKWLAFILRLPVIRMVSPIIYNTIAKNRYIISHPIRIKK